MEYPPIVQVDYNGKIIGPIMYREAHNYLNPVLHESSHVFIFEDDSYSRLLLQKRGGDVDITGVWDDSSGGHIDWLVDKNRPMAPEETAYRELEEELFDKVGLPLGLKLEQVCTFLKHTRPADREFNYLFRGVHPGPFLLNPKEVSEVKFFDIEFLLKNIEEDRMAYTDSFPFVLFKYLEAIGRYKVK